MFWGVSYENRTQHNLTRSTAFSSLPENRQTNWNQIEPLHFLHSERFKNHRVLQDIPKTWNTDLRLHPDLVQKMVGLPERNLRTGFVKDSYKQTLQSGHTFYNNYPPSFVLGCLQYQAPQKHNLNRSTVPL